MTRPQPATRTLARATVLVAGSDLPVGEALVKACRADGATVLADRDLDDIARSAAGPLASRWPSPVVLLVVGQGHSAARWRARASSEPGITIVTIHGPGPDTPDETIGTHVHHGPLDPVWTDCRGERHEWNDPARRSARDVADEVLHVVMSELASPAASRRVA